MQDGSEGIPAALDDSFEQELRFTEFLISNDYTYPYGLCAVDIDGDGDLDLTSADALPNNNLYWFENDGHGNFTRHFIQRDEPERLERHAIADMNGDGFPDVVIVQNLRGDIEWFENSGTPRDGKLWKRHFICREKLPGAYDVAVADLDGDGRLDVVASSWRLSNNFVWFQNPGILQADREWDMHFIETDIAETRTICVADFNGDGLPDLLGTASGAGQVIWYENPGDPVNRLWKKHLIDVAPRPCHGHPADMDGDGKMDVVMALGMGSESEPGSHQVVWYENPGRPTTEPWRKHVICDDFEGAFEAVAADLDGDGALEVVATAWGANGRIAWFKHSGGPQGPWKSHFLKKNWVNANQVIVADLNNDGRPDIAAVAERGSLELRWWRNEGSKSSAEARD
ncbi:MAG: VCBS repeat-containing protein [Armatimonadetes bacterium]|nr:VCBS repeat-containing protein [Armatimonadota bacterium]